MEGLRSRGRGATRIIYVGARRGPERGIIPRYSWIEAYFIHGRGLPRPLHPVGALLALAELFLGLVEALWIVLRTRPRLILGTGGYASFSAVFWGILLGVPTVILEENLYPGLANRLLAPWVTLTLVAWEETARYLRARRLVVTGVPLRRGLLEALKLKLDQRRLKAEWGLDQERPTLLVLGGSRGSEALNRAILSSRHRWDGLQVLLISGRSSSSSSSFPLPSLSPSHPSQPQRPPAPGGPGTIVIREHLDGDELGKALALADLVISRAGAATLAELTALGKPAILVPWPEAAENHQELNAQLLVRAGGAILVPEGALRAGEVDLVELSRRLLSERERLREMARRSWELGRRDGLERVLKEVEQLSR